MLFIISVLTFDSHGFASCIICNVIGMLDYSDEYTRASRLLLGRLWISEVTSFALSSATLAFSFLDTVAVEERFLLSTSVVVEVLCAGDELASDDMVKR